MVINQGVFISVEVLLYLISFPWFSSFIDKSNNVRKCRGGNCNLCFRDQYVFLFHERSLSY